MNKNLLVLTYACMISTTLYFIFIFILAYLTESKTILLNINVIGEANIELIYAIIILVLIVLTFKPFVELFRSP